MKLEPAPAPSSVEPGSEEVFTAADSSVTPPVVVRPVLPKEPPPNVRPEHIGTIDVVVDEQGDVLHVKLISPANRYHERMLVSAAKMWKFRPAYRDGRPVKFKTRVRLTI
jgi:periplasmic protein TonB